MYSNIYSRIVTEDLLEASDHSGEAPGAQWLGVGLPPSGRRAQPPTGVGACCGVRRGAGAPYRGLAMGEEAVGTEPGTLKSYLAHVHCFFC